MSGDSEQDENAGRKRQWRQSTKERMDHPAVFEKVIDALEFPLERDDVRQLLLLVCEESAKRSFEGDGLLRKYRRRRPEGIVTAVANRLKTEKA